MSAEWGVAEEEACRRLVSLALAEDLGTAGDRTSTALIAAEAVATATFVVRRTGVVAGLPAAGMVCAAVDAALVFTREELDRYFHRT